MQASDCLMSEMREEGGKGEMGKGMMYGAEEDTERETMRSTCDERRFF